MKMSAKGRYFLMELEGVILAPYRDSVGVWTIGVGHTRSAGPPDPRGATPLSLLEAQLLFARDLERYEKTVTKLVNGKRTTQWQFDALVSFQFNTGGLAKSLLLKKFLAGDMAGAIAGFMGWLKPIDIYGRRKQEQKLFAMGNYGEPFLISMQDKKGGPHRMVEIKEIV